MGDGKHRSAVCGHEMRHGRHFATFTIRSGENVFVGVVGPSFDPDPDDDDTARDIHGSAHGWGLYTWNGKLYHAGRDSAWEGQPQHEELEEGDSDEPPDWAIFERLYEFDKSHTKAIDLSKVRLTVEQRGGQLASRAITFYKAFEAKYGHQLTLFMSGKNRRVKGLALRADGGS